MIDDNTPATTTGQQLLHHNNNNNNSSNSGNAENVENGNWSLASLLKEEPRSVFDTPARRQHHRPGSTFYHHRHQAPVSNVDWDRSPSTDPALPSPPFSCETCHKVFTDPSNLQRHVRSAHASARCHTCPDCGKAFATSSGLKQHQHIHSSVKPFRCDVCLKAYTQFSNLCRHKRMHADCRQQVRCRGCHQEFATSTSLSKHRRFCDSETPYPIGREGTNGGVAPFPSDAIEGFADARGLSCGTVVTPRKISGFPNPYGGLCVYPNAFFQTPFQFPIYHHGGLPLFGSEVVGGANLRSELSRGSGAVERRRREAEGFYAVEEDTVLNDGDEEERSCSASSSPVSTLSSKDEVEDARSPASEGSRSDEGCPAATKARSTTRGIDCSDSESNLEEEVVPPKRSPGLVASDCKTWLDLEADDISERERGAAGNESPKRSWEAKSEETSRESCNVESPKALDATDRPKQVKISDNKENVSGTCTIIESPKHSKRLDTNASPRQSKISVTVQESSCSLRTLATADSPKRNMVLEATEIPKRRKTLNTVESSRRYNATLAHPTSQRIHDFTNVAEMATSEILPLDLSLKSKSVSSPKPFVSGYPFHQSPSHYSPVRSPLPPFPSASPPTTLSCHAIPLWLRPHTSGTNCALPPGFQDIAARLRSLHGSSVPMFPICLPSRNVPGLSRQRDRLYPFLSPLMKGAVPPAFARTSSSVGIYKDRYSCRFCGKVFPRSANLTRHLRTHTGEQPYKCKYCERSFSISSNLQRHVRNIHNKEKPFRCLLCDRCFGQQTNLDRHLRKHDPPSPVTGSPLPPRGCLSRRRDHQPHQDSADEDEDIVSGRKDRVARLRDDMVDVELDCEGGPLEDAELETSQMERVGVYLSDNDGVGCYENASTCSDEDGNGRRFIPVYPLNATFSVVSGLHVDT